jgi:hypothetical protein
MWAPAAITTASKPYPSGRQGRIPRGYVDLLTAMHAAVQDHSLIVSLALPGLHDKEWVHDDVTLHNSCRRQHTEQVQKTEASPRIQTCTNSRQHDTLCISQPRYLFLGRTHINQHAHLPRNPKPIQSEIPCLRVRLPLGEDCGNCGRHQFNRPRDHWPRCNHNCTPFNTGAVLLA